MRGMKGLKEGRVIGNNTTKKINTASTEHVLLVG